MRPTSWWMALALGCASPPPAEAPVADAPASVEAAEPPPGLNTGIGVHGEWKIEVRDENGAVAQHREFHNDFVDPKGALAGVLSGSMKRGTWAIRANGSLCGQDPYCYAIEPAAGPADELHFTTLEVVSFAPTHVVTLNGSFTAATSGAITEVESVLGGCPLDVSPCTAFTYGGGEALPNPFTRATLSPSIPVQGNQSVYLIVQLTFGTM